MIRSATRIGSTQALRSRVAPFSFFFPLYLTFLPFFFYKQLSGPSQQETGERRRERRKRRRRGGGGSGGGNDGGGLSNSGSGSGGSSWSLQQPRSTSLLLLFFFFPPPSPSPSFLVLFLSLSLSPFFSPFQIQVGMRDSDESRVPCTILERTPTRIGAERVRVDSRLVGFLIYATNPRSPTLSNSDKY